VIRSAEPERIVARHGARAKGLAEVGIVRFVRTDAKLWDAVVRVQNFEDLNGLRPTETSQPGVHP
jgi:hypothetical protein